VAYKAWNFNYDSIRDDPTSVESFKETVQKQLARSAGCPLDAVHVDIVGGGASDIDVRSQIDVSLMPRAQMSTFQHVQSELTSKESTMAKDWWTSMQEWMEAEGKGKVEGLPITKLGIEYIQTSISGMEHLPGYPPEFDPGSESEISLGAHGAASGGISKWLWAVLAALFVFCILGSVAAFVYTRMKGTANSNRNLKRQTRSAKVGYSSDSEYEMGASSGGGEDSEWEAEQTADESGGQDDTERDLGQPLMHDAAYAGQALDLVTVTPKGLAVTPIGGPPPAGVPILDASAANHGIQGLQARQEQQQRASQGMDLVQVTPNGLNVVPLNGPPPAGVPVLGPAGLPAAAQHNLGMQQVAALGTQTWEPGTAQFGGAMGQAERVAALGTQTFGPQPVAAFGTQSAMGPMMGAGGMWPQTQQLAPMPTMGAQSAMGPMPVPTMGAVAPGRGEEFDLVTVTEQGLQVTPLNGAQAPAGLPILETEAHRHQSARALATTTFR
jgi:hypothetical protein